MGQASRLEPGPVFVEGLVQVLGASHGDVPIMDREGPDRSFGRLASTRHPVERGGETGPVRPRFAVDQQGIAATLEEVEQDQ